jgi:hypothetical protein
MERKSDILSLHRNAHFWQIFPGSSNGGEIGTLNLAKIKSTVVVLWAKNVSFKCRAKWFSRQLI